MWKTLQDEIEYKSIKCDELEEENKELKKEIESLKKWISDLQSGLYINCVYCGHRYPPGTPDVRDKVLYEHIKECPKHPLSKVRKLLHDTWIMIENATKIDFSNGNVYMGSDEGNVRGFEFYEKLKKQVEELELI